MKTVVLSLGGSIIVPGEIDTVFLQQFKALITKHSDIRFVIVCGGGKTARKYQDAAKKLGVSSSQDLDWIGIESTRINGELVRSLFGEEAYECVVWVPQEKIKTNKRIIIAAGEKPGHSTDYDAVLLAQNIGADLIINLSNIEYACDKDPKMHKDARRLETVSWKNFRTIVGNTWEPGLNMPFDPVASREAEKLKLKVIIVKGTDIANLEKTLNGEKFKGTLIG